MYNETPSEWETYLHLAQQARAANRRFDDMRQLPMHTVFSFDTPNGTVTGRVFDNSRNIVTEPLINEVRRTVEKLIAVTPPFGDVEIFMGDSEIPEFVKSHGITTRVDKDFRANPDFINHATNPNRVVVITQSAFTHNATNSWAHMPTLSRTNDLVYTVVHEWGHVIDTDNHDLNLPQRIIDRMDNSPNPYNRLKILSDMSVYGGSNPVESHAEAFAEWFLSGGKTENFAAQWYAREYDWPNLKSRNIT